MTFRNEAAERLKAYIARLEALAVERRENADDQRAVFAELKADGFDPKAVRKIVKRRDQDATELAEQETILETYMHAIGMLPDHPLHLQIAALARDGLSRDEVIETLQKFVPANGEIIARVGGDPFRVWRDEAGVAYAQPYLGPAPQPDKVGKGLKRGAAVLSIVTGEPVDRRGVDPAITSAADRAELAARKKRGEDEPNPSPPAPGDDDQPEPAE